MSKLTFVIEFEEGKAPPVHAHMKALGGKVVSVAFRDALDNGEFETLQRICAEAYQCVGYLAEECGAADDEHVIKLMDNLSQMKLVHEDLLPFQLSDSTPVNDVTSGKPLTITLPDASSKAFWSGTGKGQTFHPETYKRWVKEAIERACAIASIEVRVK